MLLLGITMLYLLTMMSAEYVYNEEAERILFEGFPPLSKHRIMARSLDETEDSVYFYDYAKNQYKVELERPDFNELSLCTSQTLPESLGLCGFTFMCITEIVMIDFEGDGACMRQFKTRDGYCTSCNEPHTEIEGRPTSIIVIGFYEKNYPRSESSANGIVFKNSTSACYIGSSKSTNPQDCPKDAIIYKEDLTFFDVVGKGFTGDKDFGIVFENQWINSIASYDCTFNDANGTRTLCSQSEYTSCRAGSCRGEQNFCNIFGCSGISRCYCAHNKATEEAVVKSNKAIGTFKSSVSLPTVRYTPKFDINTGIPACYGVSFNCDKNKITIVEASKTITDVRLKRGMWDVFYSLDRNDVNIVKKIQMPLEMSLLPDIILAEFWVTDFSTPCNQTFDCKAVKVCDMIDCFFCKIAWASVNCYGAGQLSILVVSSIVLSIPLALILRGLYILLKFMIWNNVVVKNLILYIWLKFKSVFYYMKRKMIVVRTHLTNDMNKMKEWNMKTEEIKFNQLESSAKARDYKAVAMAEYSRIKIESNEEKMKRIQERIRAERSKKLILCILILTFIGLSSACSEVQTFTVSQDACVIGSNGNTVCTVKQSMIISAAPTGQYACFNVNSPDGKPMGSIQIKFTDILLRCDSYRLYYIPDTEPYVISYFRCDAAGECSANQCNNVQANPDMLNSISYVQNNKDGRVDGGCSFVSADGLATSDNCFHGNGCFYWSFSLMRRSPRVIEQTACSSWQFVMKAEVSVLNLQDSKSTQIDLIPGITETVNNNLHFQIISASVPPTYLTNLCIGKSDRSYSIYECNKRDELVAGKIGELQCPTESAAAGLKGCLVSASSYTHTINSKGIVVNSKMIDVWKTFYANTLPYRLSSGIVIYKGADNETYASFTKTAMTQISLTIDDLKLTSVTTKSTCTVSSVSLTGCFSCNNGADWNFIGKTDFGSAVATIKCPSINFMTIVSLAEQTRDEKVKISMTSGDIDANCVVECPGGSTNFVLKGTLDWIPPEDPRENTTTTGEYHTGGSGNVLGQIWGSISKYIYGTIGVIVLIIFFVLVFFLVRNVILPVLSAKRSVKTEKVV